jgi:hypothetical protein
MTERGAIRAPRSPLKITQYCLTSANFSKLTHDCHVKLGGQSETKQLDCGYREGEKLFSPISCCVECFCTSRGFTITDTKEISIDLTIALSLCNKVDHLYMKISLYCSIVNSDPINFYVGGVFPAL